ncbi:LOW QUALITY PROTEIN: hypothetical protein BRADI_4g12868v3 [Brachypodium distachyon]|uniref:BTB domain-containing protein n=1 Tax=Brachypodium distachyon TaxID=15368 RepID=A0A2K2CME4_BRADI|nr:LOW QUALITY PROTEIN: hypothetical protein BRADI_4g12868v3 [Brachypodium distachyon]
MSMSALLTALRAAGQKQLSASTLSGSRKATGAHVFRMGEYTKVREKVAIGTAVKSSTFSIGATTDGSPTGRSWTSVYLRHASHARTGNATAKFEMSLVDQAGKPLHTMRSGQRCFSSSWYYEWGFSKFMKHADLHDQEKHLKGDSLTVLCGVTIDLGLDSTAVPVPEPAAAPPPFDLRGHPAEAAIWKSHEADVQIEVSGGETTFAAHRAVLKDQSPVFRAELSSKTDEDDNTVVLRIDDMDADVCKALLQFVYTESAPETDQLQAMAGRLLAAAKYKLEKLKLICEQALCKNIDMGSVAATLTLAERHGCPLLKNACIRFLSAPGNLEAVIATDGFEQLKTGMPFCSA